MSTPLRMTTPLGVSLSSDLKRALQDNEKLTRDVSDAKLLKEDAEIKLKKIRNKLNGEHSEKLGKLNDKYKAVQEELKTMKQSSQLKREKGVLETENRRLETAKSELDRQLLGKNDELRMADVEKVEDVKMIRDLKAGKRPPFKTEFKNLISRSEKFRRIEIARAELQRCGGEASEFYCLLLGRLSKLGLLKWKMSKREGLYLYHASNLTRRRFTKLKQMLRGSGCIDPLPSIHEIKKLEKVVGSSDQLKVTEHTVDGKSVVAVHLLDVVKMLTERINELVANGKMVVGDDPIWLTILGDKGSEEFKLCLSIGNVSQPNSCFHLIPLGIFNDDESSENIRKYLGPIVEQLNRLLFLKIKVGDKDIDVPVEQYLGGDMKFQCDAIGHEGGNSTYQCMQCFSLRGQSISRSMQLKRGDIKKTRISKAVVNDRAEKLEELEEFLSGTKCALQIVQNFKNRQVNGYKSPSEPCRAAM
ncbi:Autophagy-related protein 14 [Caenorhabditis elegans]|uniref:Autophagy-related protein 14 n=1 Tax=Caenorhabditis elegans TaxID=6239 RepID=Q09494_CAEEL|nr:Autophagy-related protein 14 [Caenorhabditis elegans]CAA87099.1 Autophagy-related protein 14 [Caenorhabditis elegans]|eukprot:NP_497711.1 Uncharacterized protein CELE_C34C12.1 [Caenorhabditis elegans]